MQCSSRVKVAAIMMYSLIELLENALRPLPPTPMQLMYFENPLRAVVRPLGCIRELKPRSLIEPSSDPCPNDSLCRAQPVCGTNSIAKRRPGVELAASGDQEKESSCGSCKSFISRICRSASFPNSNLSGNERVRQQRHLRPQFDRILSAIRSHELTSQKFR